MPYYLEKNNVGTEAVYTLGDGKSMEITWNQAYPSNPLNKIAYNIYVSTSYETVFTEGPKYISYEAKNFIRLTDLIPGQMYYFGVRPVEYSPILYDLSLLPTFGDATYYPESILRENLTSNGLEVKMVDTSEFPSSGFIKIGTEIIKYSSNNLSLNNLLVSTLSDRGINSKVRLHNVDGYDGYTYQPTYIKYYVQTEALEYDRVFKNQSRFEYPEYAYTSTDGYKQVTSDDLTSDLSASDLQNKDFPYQDYKGYRRVDPVLLMTGVCVGSYIGGEQYCVDGYSGVGRTLRGFSLQDRNNQNQEELLEIVGEPVVLLRRSHTGIRCSCFTPGRESQQSRCEYCFGTGFIPGYNQFFYERRSDGRILARFSPSKEQVKLSDLGFESEFSTECWTLTYPTIKDRDILVRYSIDGEEEFRYEVIDVARNKTIVGQQGAQKMQVQRIRKTDIYYQIPIFKDSSKIPRKVLLEFGGNAAVPPHTHEIVLSENITNISQVNQVSSMSQGHSHIIKNGLILGIGAGSALQHTHIVKLI